MKTKIIKCDECHGCGKDYDYNHHNGNKTFTEDRCIKCKGDGVITIELTLEERIENLERELNLG